MRTLGIYEVKTRLPQLVREVEHGETVVITNRGRPVARIVPEPSNADQVRAAVEAMKAMRKVEGVSAEQVRAWIDEGRA